MSKISIAPALGLAAASLLVILPFFWLGIPSGHDFEFHVYSWMDVQSQWKQGILFPQWAALAHWGYGEARFIFYPPASWTLGAALGTVLPWKLVPGVYCWLALFFGAAAMYRLARKWLGMTDAMFAAAFFALNPYHLLVIYWRSAYAELLASALLPLLVLCILGLTEPGLLPVLRLSVILAAAWLINVPAAVMIHYSAALIALMLAVLSAWGFARTGESQPPQGRRDDSASAARRSLSILGRTIASVAIGAGLAAFYLFPVAYEQHWVNLGEVFAEGVRPQDNFLFTSIQDTDHNHFNLLVSGLAASEFAVLSAAIWLSLRRLAKSSAPVAPSASAATAISMRRILTLFAAWATVSAILMFSGSNFAWLHLPALRLVQLPFRWLLCLNAALAMLLVFGLRSWPPRLLTLLSLIAILLAAGRHFQPPWWDNSADIREMSDAIADGTGYEGIDEYVPAGDDPYELKKTLPRVSDGSGTVLPVRILKWGPTEKHFRFETQTPEDLQVRLFNYPAWKATVNGAPVEIQSADTTGLMQISVSAGTNDVRIVFQQTRDRKIGDAVSPGTLIVLVAGAIVAQRKRVAQARI